MCEGPRWLLASLYTFMCEAITRSGLCLYFNSNETDSVCPKWPMSFTWFGSGNSLTQDAYCVLVVCANKKIERMKYSMERFLFIRATKFNQRYN